MRRRRTANAAYPVLCQVKGQGVRAVKRISLEKGEALVSSGAAVPMFDRHDKLVGFRMRGEAAKLRASKPVGELPRVVPVTAHESQLNAGIYGESKTAGLSENDRQWLLARGLVEAAEDEIELAQVKVRTWREPSAPPRVHVVVPPARLHAA